MADSGTEFPLALLALPPHLAHSPQRHLSSHPSMATLQLALATLGGSDALPESCFELPQVQLGPRRRERALALELLEPGPSPGDQHSCWQEDMKPFSI